MPPDPSFDLDALRSEFPILETEIRGRPLVYLDSAATAQKPRSVIGAVERFYASENSNIHRGVHHLSAEATTAYEAVREGVRRFLNARHEREVVFTSGTTAAINLVASSFGDRFVGAGDEVVVTGMEHHANLVPWQMLCERKGARLRPLPISDAGEIDLSDLDRVLSDRTRIVAVVHVSNSLGTVNPVAEVIRRAHARGVPVLVDAAQSIPHMPVDVQALDCDFLVFSAHKVYGPTGTGVLYGKEKWLEAMPPWQGGGDMIRRVTLEKTEYNELPFKFEAGTPHIAGVIGLGAALEFVEQTGRAAIAAHESALLAHAVEALSGIEGIRLIGTPRERAGVVSFLLDGVHPYDTGVILDQMGIAVRTGHHCCEPVMDRYGIPGTVRASFAAYSTHAEVEALAEGVRRAARMLA